MIGERYVRWAWIEGQGWRSYPLRLPMIRPAVWSDTPPEPRDVADGIVTVWVGPYANKPDYPSPSEWKVMTPRPQPVYSSVPVYDLPLDGWREWHARKVIPPDRGCAWPFAIELSPVWAVVTWKVWDYEV